MSQDLCPDWPGLKKVSTLRGWEREGAMRHIAILCGNGGLFLGCEMERGADGTDTGYTFADMLCDLVRLGAIWCGWRRPAAPLTAAARVEVDHLLERLARRDARAWLPGHRGRRRHTARRRMPFEPCPPQLKRPAEAGRTRGRETRQPWRRRTAAPTVSRPKAISPYVPGSGTTWMYSAPDSIVMPTGGKE